MKTRATLLTRKKPAEADSPHMLGTLRAFGGIFTAILSFYLLSISTKYFPSSGWIALPLMIILVFLSGLSVFFIEFWLSRSAKP
jgi:hypothetical protein